MPKFKPHRSEEPWWDHDELGMCRKTMELRELFDLMTGTKYSDLLVETIYHLEGLRMRQDNLERTEHRLKNKIHNLEKKLTAAYDDIGRLHAAQDMARYDK